MSSIGGGGSGVESGQIVTPSPSLSSTPTIEILRNNELSIDITPKQRRPSQPRMSTNINSIDDNSNGGKNFLVYKYDTFIN